MSKRANPTTTNNSEPQTSRQLYRQGDVLFERISVLPTDTVLREGHVLVEGEITGHAHRVAPTCQAKIRVVSGTELMYLECPRSAQIVHEEHHTVTLPAGLYRVTVQREYSPQEIRRVVD